MRNLTPVTFTPEPSGRVQLARTGSGFWRRDHAAPFAIDKELLVRMLYNTQMRKRPLRMDFMHYANGSDDPMPLEALGAAGCIDPSDITLEPWTEPSTGVEGWGLFAPNSWTAAGARAVEDGIDEISPVIAWEFSLTEDTTDPDTGATIPAGTMVGPCITGVSLVDRGFFWMDKVKLYSERGGHRAIASLYQETAMALPLEKLQTLIAQLIKAGFTQEEAAPILSAAMTAEAAKKEEAKPESPVMPAKEAAPAPAAPAVLAARLPNTGAAMTKTLRDLWTEAKTASSSTNIGEQAFSEKLATIDERLSRIEASHDELMIADLERQGLLVNIPNPRKLYKEAPAYFMELVSKATPLTTASPAGAGKPSGLRTIAKDAGLTDDDKFAMEVKAYREEQHKAGNKIDQVQAIEHVERRNKARS